MSKHVVVYVLIRFAFLFCVVTPSMMTTSSRSIWLVSGADAQVGTDGSVNMDADDPLSISNRLVRDSDGILTKGQATKISEWMDTLMQEEETSNLLSAMKFGGGKETFDALASDLQKSRKDAVLSMYATYKTKVLVDVLFTDNAGKPVEDIFVELIKAGVVDKHTMNEYQDNPSQLQTDTERSLKMKFTTVAAAIGYL